LSLLKYYQSYTFYTNIRL